MKVYQIKLTSPTIYTNLKFSAVLKNLKKLLKKNLKKYSQIFNFIFKIDKLTKYAGMLKGININFLPSFTTNFPDFGC